MLHSTVRASTPTPFPAAPQSAIAAATPHSLRSSLQAPAAATPRRDCRPRKALPTPEPAMLPTNRRRRCGATSPATRAWSQITAPARPATVGHASCQTVFPLLRAPASALASLYLLPVL